MVGRGHHCIFSNYTILGSAGLRYVMERFSVLGGPESFNFGKTRGIGLVGDTVSFGQVECFPVLDLKGLCKLVH